MLSIQVRKKIVIDISVIIPIYNVEKYIQQCMESVIGQTFANLEIICVDDGSTDGSAEILDRYATYDARVVVIHNENHGYGYSVNYGIKHAKGKYLAVVESDDYILPDMYALLFSVAEAQQAEIVKGDFCEFRSSHGIEYTVQHNYSVHGLYNFIFKPTETLESFFDFSFTWNGIYLNSFIKKYNIFHNETPGAAFQDTGFWFQTMMYASRVYYLNQSIYMYRKDNYGASTYDRKKVQAFVDETEFIRRKISESTKHNKYLLRYIATYINLNNNVTSLNRVAEEHLPELCEVIATEYKEAVENREFQITYYEDNVLRQILYAMYKPEDLCNTIIAYRSGVCTWMQKLKKFNNIVVYGVGNYAGTLTRLFDNYNIWKSRNIYYAVTVSGENVGRLYTKPVDEIRKLRDMISMEDTIVLLCVKRNTENYKAMKQTVIDLKYPHIEDAAEIVEISWYTKIAKQF